MYIMVTDIEGRTCVLLEFMFRDLHYNLSLDEFLELLVVGFSCDGIFA